MQQLQDWVGLQGQLLPAAVVQGRRICGSPDLNCLGREVVIEVSHCFGSHQAKGVCPAFPTVLFCGKLGVDSRHSQ